MSQEEIFLPIILISYRTYLKTHLFSNINSNKSLENKNTIIKGQFIVDVKKLKNNLILRINNNLFHITSILLNNLLSTALRNSNNNKIINICNLIYPNNLKNNFSSNSL